MNSVKIGIVDDHPFIARGLKAIIETEENLTVIWTASDVEAALARLSLDPVDVMTVDLKMGASIAGLTLLRKLKELNSEVMAIVLSSYAPPRLVRECAALGAKGFFKKDESGQALVEAIKALGRGERDRFHGRYSNISKPSVYMEISDRELQVLLEIAKGKSNADVAEELELSTGTVKTHLESIYRKLGASNRTEALRTALAEGYFTLDEIM